MIDEKIVIRIRTQFPNADAAFADACREWLRGCTCAAADAPQECEECTLAFLEAIINRARAFGVAMGENAISR